MTIRKISAFLAFSAFIALTSVSASAFADDASDVSALLRQGQLDAAAARLETALASKPRDAQLRFLRGVIQIEQKKVDDAIVTFQRMTDDFPDLPEPYNNLAVLYAGKSQYDKARVALELAIRTHPSYTTAHENLGDVYAKLASESYNKALQLDTSNNAAQVKLNVIKDLIGGKTVKPTAPEASVVKPVVVTALTPPAAFPVAAAKPVVAVPVAVVPMAVKTPVVLTPVAPVAASKPEVEQTDSAAEAEILKLLQTWASAWSSRNVDAYLATYAQSFRAADGGSRKIWAAERRERIENKKSIRVVIEKPTVTVDGNKATLRFRQGYEADSLRTSGVKVMGLSNAEGAWRIVSERTGS